MGPEPAVTLQPLIFKPDLFFWEPGGRGDIEISGAASVEGLSTKDYFMCLERNNLDPGKSNSVAKEAELTLPDPSTWVSA